DPQGVIAAEGVAYLLPRNVLALVAQAQALGFRPVPRHRVPDDGAYRVAVARLAGVFSDRHRGVAAGGRVDVADDVALAHDRHSGLWVARIVHAERAGARRDAQGAYIIRAALWATP